VLYASPSAASVWGRGPGEIVGEAIGVPPAVHADDRQELASALDRAADGEPSECEYRLVRRDGEEQWVRTRFYPVADRSGEVNRVAATTEDVSERKQLRSQLLQVQKIEAIGRLAGGIAHDFNNQLTAILGFAKLLEGGVSAAEHVEYLREILKAAEHSRTLTQKLLAFSRRQILRPQVVDLGSVVMRVDSMLRRLIDRKIELVTLPGSTPKRVKADPSQLEQVIVNLVLNARDAVGGGGRILVQVLERRVEEPMTRSHGAIPGGDYVVLAVSDDGIGMDTETVSRVFEPFYTTKPPGKGSGLGLPVALGIVEQSGGHISLMSRPGAGTTVEVYMPAAVEQETRAAPPAQDGERGHGTVLLVEDEPAVRSLTRQMLSRAGYSVLEAENGEQALRIWRDRRGSIDLVITDLTMPLMGGRELGERLEEEAEELPVLFMSGYSDSFAGGIEGPAAIRGFVAKPFTREELLGAVGALMAAHPRQ
jgi:two-component system, cell cycle sensor histidine kinase and response regulator CckA